MGSHSLRVFVQEVARSATVLKITLWRREAGFSKESQAKPDLSGRLLARLALAEPGDR
jgi:hypothetical protein